MIEDMVEAFSDQKTLNEYPELNKEFIKPTFLILRARKVNKWNVEEHMIYKYKAIWK